MLRKKVIAVETVFGRAELDFQNTGFENFRYRGKTAPHTVTSNEVGRPDLVSIACYGDDKFWWILMKYNKICDVWNDLRAGMVLRYPPRSEIERWYVEASKRKGLT